MSSIDAWYLGISVSTEKGFAVPLNFLLKVSRMRSLREICVPLCITEHSHVLSLLLYSIPVLTHVMHAAGATSQICLVFLHLRGCLDKILKCEHLPLNTTTTKKSNQLLNTHWSVGIIRGASKQSQSYILHSSLGYETTPHSCAVSYQVLRQSRNAGTKACKGRTNSSLQGNWMAPQQNSRCSAFLLPPHHKSSISVFIKFFFELVMLRLDFVFVCFEEEEGNSLVRASNTAIICHK